MAELNFAQTSRRRLAVPLLIAVVVLGATGIGAYLHLAGRTVTANIRQTVVFPIRVTYKAEPQQASGFKVLNEAPAAHDEGVYVLTTVHIDNHLTVPVFLKDFHATVETPSGQLHASAIEKADLPAVTGAFPELASKLVPPLLRETTVPPGQSSDGVAVLQFPILESAWKARTSAALTIDLYHQPSVVIPIHN